MKSIRLSPKMKVFIWPSVPPKMAPNTDAPVLVANIISWPTDASSVPTVNEVSPVRARVVIENPVPVVMEFTQWLPMEK